jgi:hypothetical protein
MEFLLISGNFYRIHFTAQDGITTRLCRPIEVQELIHEISVRKMAPYSVCFMIIPSK